MPSHLSTLGFDVASEDDLLALADQVAELAEVIAVEPGRYLRWVGGSGEESWLYLNHAGDLVGYVPHFRGPSSVPLASGQRVHREDDTEMDGAFEAMVGADRYPIVFDVPDGHVVESDTKRNAITGNPFYWASVDSLEARFDVVVDPTLLDGAPEVGSVLAGESWLSGRLISYQREEPSRLERLLGR